MSPYSPNYRFSILAARAIADDVAGQDVETVAVAQKQRDKKLTSLMCLTMVELRRDHGSATEVELIRAGFLASEIIRLGKDAADAAARFEGGRAWPEAA